MKKIPMLDLNAEVADLTPDLNKAIQSVLTSTQFINGPEVTVLEEELASYHNVANVITCGNGTDALMISLMAAGLKPGDGVITSPFTFFATAEVIAFLGLEVQFADILPDSYNIDPASIKKNIKPNTRAIIPVHLFGQTADMASILDIAADHELIIIEDSAQATGGVYHYNGVEYLNGTIGDVGCTSFFPSKNLGCYGDGGAIFTDNDDIADKCRMIKNHGSRIKYSNEIIGVNSRLDSIQAAILRVKLGKLDEHNQRRHSLARRYNHGLKDLDALVTPIMSVESEHVFHQYTLRVVDGRRQELQQFLQERGISTAIYYSTPLHLQKALKELPYIKGDFPVAELLAEQVLSLPIGPYLQEEDQVYVIDAIRDFYNKI